MKNTESTGIQCPYADKTSKNILRFILVIITVLIFGIGLLIFTGKTEHWWTFVLGGQTLIATYLFLMWREEKKHGRVEAFRQGRESTLGIAKGIKDLTPNTKHEVELVVRKHKRVHLLIKKGLHEAPGKPFWCTISETNFDTSLGQIQAHDIGQIRVWESMDEDGGVAKIVTAVRRPPPVIHPKAARINPPSEEPTKPPTPKP